MQYQSISNDWKIGLCEGSVSTCCYSCWCPWYVYADLAEATGAVLPGMTREHVCCSYAFSSTWDRHKMTMDVLTRIRQLKGIRAPESGCEEFCTIICCKPCVYRQMLVEMEGVQVVQGAVTKQPERGQAIITT